MKTAVLDPTIAVPLEKAKAIAAAAEADGDRDFTDEERATVTALLNEAKAAKNILSGAQIKSKQTQEMLAAIAQMDSGEPVSQADAKALNDWALRGATTGLDADLKSLGDKFVQSDEFKSLVARYPNGIGKEARVAMDPYNVGPIKALVGSTGVPGLVPIDQRGFIGPEIWGRDLMIRQAITVGSTDSDLVEYARQNVITNAAAPVPESATDAADATPTTAEGFKPQSVFSFTKVSEPVRTVAHWLAATKRALSDAAQVRTLIDSFLRFGLDEELEDQIISGDGTGENFDGILTVSGTTAQAFDTDAIVTIRKAITKVRTVGRAQATAVALNPVDDEALDLATDTTDRFFGAGPFGTGPSTIWGRPRIVTEAVPAGTAIVADWRFAALWDRQQATVSVTDSHADFFIRNLVAVLAELRAAFGVIRPAAFVIADLTL